MSSSIQEKYQLTRNIFDSVTKPLNKEGFNQVNTLINVSGTKRRLRELAPNIPLHLLLVEDHPHIIIIIQHAEWQGMETMSNMRRFSN